MGGDDDNHCYNYVVDDFFITVIMMTMGSNFITVIMMMLYLCVCVSELIQTEVYHMRTLKLLLSVYQYELRHNLQMEETMLDRMFPQVTRTLRDGERERSETEPTDEGA